MNQFRRNILKINSCKIILFKQLKFENYVFISHRFWFGGGEGKKPGIQDNVSPPNQDQQSTKNPTISDHLFLIIFLP